jgi:hypothetical protein
MLRARFGVDTTISAESSEPGNTPCGAVWRKVDPYLYPPGIDSFHCPNGVYIHTDARRQKIIESYMRQTRTANIAVETMTDYHGIRPEWFIPIREQARRYGITESPGAEISPLIGKHGLHVLAVFSDARGGACGS